MAPVILAALASNTSGETQVRMDGLSTHSHGLDGTVLRALSHSMHYLEPIEVFRSCKHFAQHSNRKSRGKNVREENLN